jgi:hypothetical protein
MNVANVLKNPATHWAAARWRLRFLVGRVSSFVPVPGTHYALGVFGQSPLPEKIRMILQAARWRLRFLVGLGLSLRASA